MIVIALDYAIVAMERHKAHMIVSKTNTELEEGIVFFDPTGNVDPCIPIASSYSQSNS